VADELRVNDELSIPIAEVELRASRSSGPGGQHANVTASRVEAVFDVRASAMLDESQRERLLRRAGPAQLPVERLEFGGLTIDAAAREAVKDGTVLKLTAKEFDLLWFLASNPRRVFSREQLMSRVWGYRAAFDTGTVTVHVRRLREKIEDDPAHPAHLETVWGAGYRFSP